MATIGDRLRELRYGIQLSQAKLGKILGISQARVFKYETNALHTPPKVLLQYADYFDVSLDYIYGRTDDPHGMYYENKLPIEQVYPEMDKFIEMCFEPGTAMNERLKETMKRMMTEEAKQ